MNDIAIALAELKASRKPKPAKVAQRISDEARAMYLQAHYRKTQKRTPSVIADGHYQVPDLLVNDANSLTNAIVNFINWEGWNATGVSSAGRYADGKWIPGRTRKGTGDISSTIKGMSVKIEVKWGKDTPRALQIKEQKRERAAGGVYEFIGSFDAFIELYKRLLNAQ